ncbi:MAG: family 10 glycosylhydrolase [Ignavibacteriales bacterium]|jgi:uncharacterized lipoprotein YddW (UPF0748 family)|nr:family 10 glycosylhydrolase [Ignavibacteriaceae bacterium]NLH60153.1 family 10 glycosylhydrolase [Ignavibacteriales bacterium]HOJ17271.1 family 10 glycosylhydrolase [Ignavibacteriaceae bacterium]HPO54460.1 family 10 glycosylhydrolase [Ignavibacteriaceae bacterium]
MVKRVWISILLSLMFFVGASAQKIPNALREMRAVWVATVANIDWPSRPGLTTEQQKAEALAILDKVKSLNMNAVILQVRPQADAIYPSELEPWSYFLTGQQGKAPDPFYDPLKFWIDEAHVRGLELHAWLNPYRANHSSTRGELAPNSVVKSKSHLVKKLGSAGYYWMDPALAEVQDHSYAVAMDIAKRYDVDAIHLDDYFYPYRDYNDNQDFPDDDSYNAYKTKGGKLTKSDWRRDAVNKFIKRLYDGIRKTSKTVKFGISPFGTYRPNHPEGYGGTFDAYEILSADAKLWLNKGWVDYFVPQLYWNISRIELSYPILLQWWLGENKKGIHLWPGLFIRPEVERNTMMLEIVNQILVARGMIKDYPGTMTFSMRSLMSNDTITTRALLNGPFRNHALVPPYKWIDSKAPDAPIVKIEKGSYGIKISWTPKGKKIPWQYVVYKKAGEVWSYEIHSFNTRECLLKDTKVTEVIVTAVDRCGNESSKKPVKL